MNLLKVAGIGKREGGNHVLQGISFTQQKFERLALAGATGSGKTTLLKIIAGLIQPDTGEVLFEGKRVTGPMEQLIPGFRGIAYLSQHFELRNNYRVEEVLQYANILPEKEARTLFEVCRIGHLLQRKTDQLSGGERQRIALAKLLTTSPRLLLLDEPFSNLDPLHRNNLKSVIRDIGGRLKITCLLVSHDPMDTLPWADRVLVLQEGRLVQEGSARQVYRQPVNEYVAGLFGKYNVIDGNRIVRPEDVKISRQSVKGAVKGKIDRVSFAGSYYEIEVSLPGAAGGGIPGVITVNTPSGQFAEGDTVYILIDHDNHHL
jgi:ABC-type sugar transport system ATPase subunit